MAAVIEELDRRKCSELVEEIVRLEKKTFPKHESLARSLVQEVMRKNSGLIYAKVASEGRGGGEIVGYVMYSWISSLCASITKLAVKENYRRQGIGEALMKAAIQKCRTRNVLRVCLHVDPERIPAVSFLVSSVLANKTHKLAKKTKLIKKTDQLKKSLINSLPVKMVAFDDSVTKRLVDDDQRWIFRAVLT